MVDAEAPWHAHVYYDDAQRAAAEALRERLIALTAAGSEPRMLYVGRMAEGPIGPHPLPQFESHFAGRWRDAIVAMIEATGLRALVHPLTDDDLADHTTLAHWVGEPLALDLTVLDPPGANQGAARFGTSDF
ncbi:MAG: DOPA 4,5-dioxygenase family protein [Novosphingobium sp.]|nr:DOPA 4,5-dioxygenase family protein [Novosphingobium sp.]